MAISPSDQPNSSYSPAPAAATWEFRQLAPWNTLAIIAFVSAFFVFIVAIILGHTALVQIRRTGERGHGLALAAVIIGYGIAVLIVVLVILAFWYAGVSGVFSG